MLISEVEEYLQCKSLEPPVRIYDYHLPSKSRILLYVETLEQACKVCGSNPFLVKEKYPAFLDLENGKAIGWMGAKTTAEMRYSVRWYLKNGYINEGWRFTVLAPENKTVLDINTILGW